MCIRVCRCVWLCVCVCVCGGPQARMRLFQGSLLELEGAGWPLGESFKVAVPVCVPTCTGRGDTCGGEEDSLHQLCVCVCVCVYVCVCVCVCVCVGGGVGGGVRVCEVPIST